PLNTDNITNAVCCETYDETIEDEYLTVVPDNQSMGLYKMSGAVGQETVSSIGSVQAPMAWTGNTPEAAQMGSATTVHGNTNVIISCLYRNGSVWVSQAVEPTSGPSRSVAQWWEFDPGLHLVQFGRVDDPS